MGKSTELKALHAASPSPSLLCGLGPYRSGAAILDFLERQDRWQKWRTDRGPLELFLDGLDECLLTVPEVVQFLIDTFTNFGTRGLSLRIACRTGAWPPRLAESLQAWYGPNFEVVELLPLTREGASSLAGHILNDETTALRFQHELRRPEIELLAARPVTLRMLIKLFAREKLPDSRIDLYRRGLRMLLSEWDVEKARRRAPFVDDPLPLASWIAAALTLGNRTSLAERRRDDLQDGDIACITVSELATQDWDRHIVETAILSAAFLDTDTSDEQGWVRVFAHRTFAEFLAAQWLYERRLLPARILSLIGDTRRVAPQMEEVASWLAALDSAWFSALLEIQPELVVRGDPAALPPDRRREALVAILAACATGALQDNTTGWEHELWRLDYPGIEDDLAAAIRAEIPAGRSLFVSRRVAIAMAKDLCPALAARDPAGAAKLLDTLATTAALPDTETANSNVRNTAGWALHELAADGRVPTALIVSAVQQLRPALALADVSDRGEFRGLALMLLFPRWMGEAELVEHMTSLPRLDYSGNYALLLGHHLPPLIATSNSLAALLGQWLARRIRTSKDLGRYSIPDTFIGAIIDTCVAAYPDPAPADAVAELLFTASFHGVRPTISPNLVSDPERRRGVLRGVLQRWTMRRWALLASRLQHFDPNAAAGNTDAHAALLPRLTELAALTAGDVAPVERIRKQCGTWTIPMLREAFRQTQSRDHVLERENLITWHLTPQLSHSDDFLYWARQAAQEDDPLLREEFTNTARKLLNPDPEESNRLIAELRAIVASTADTIRESLEADFQDLLDDQRLSDLRAERSKHRPRQGREDGKTPQARLAELLESGYADPRNVFPIILMALPLRPTDTHRGDPYSGDLTEFAAWKESSPAMRQEIRTLARAFLSQENPQEDTWVGKPEFPSTLLDACRAFQLLALDPADPPDLGLPAEVWRTWARTLLDKLDSLQPRLDGILRELARQAPDAAAGVLELLETAHRRSNEHDQSRLVRTALVVQTPPVTQALIQHAQAADLPIWPDRNILMTLVEEGNAVVHALALARLADDTPATRIYRVNAILALATERRKLRVSEWPAVWNVLRTDDEALVDVLAALGSAFVNRSSTFREIPDLGDFLDRVLSVLPFGSEDDRSPRDRTLRAVSPRMQAARARDQILQFLADRAHPQDVALIQRIADEHHELSLFWLHNAARTALERRTWSPLGVTELEQLSLSCTRTSI